MDYGKILIKVFDNSNTSVDRFMLSVRNDLSYDQSMVSDDELKSIWSSSQTAIDNKVRSNTSGGTRSSGSGFSGFLSNVVRSQQTQNPNSTYDTRDLTTLIDFATFSSKRDGESMVKHVASELASKAGAGIESEVIRNLKIEADLRRSINEDIGITGELSDGLRRDIRIATGEAILYGYGVKEVTDMVVQLMDSTGRFNMISEDTMSSAAPVARAFVGSLSEMGRVLANFQNIGVGFDNSIELIEDIGIRSTSLGLSAKGTIKDITTNLDKINQYGFKNGVDGLAEMSRKSREFRMNMQNIFTIAENVFTPEKAIDMAANLQVLGGAIGDFNDPLRLMYMSTNNVEGLQDALIGAASGLATYNEEQGRFELTGVNLRIAHEMANTLGISLEDLSRTAIASAERVDASMALMASGLDLDDDEKRFLTNLSRMEGGQMIISLPTNIAEEMGLDTTKIALSDMSEELKDKLIEQQKRFEGMDARDLAQAQVTTLENINRQITSIVEYLAVGATNLVADYSEFFGVDNLSKQGLGMIDNARGSVRDLALGGTLSPRNLFPIQNQNRTSEGFTNQNLAENAMTNTTRTENINVRMSITSDTNAGPLTKYIQNNSDKLPFLKNTNYTGEN